jgi:ribosome maturation factor RimP
MATVPGDRLVALLSPVVSAAGLDLEDVIVRPAGRRSLVQVFVDRDGGVTLDDIARVSRDVSTKLDETDALGTGPYTLEVSSPGVDRPLTLPRHWRRAVGRLIAVTPVSGAPFTGQLVALTVDDVQVDTATGTRTVALSNVQRAVVEVEFVQLNAETAD